MWSDNNRYFSEIFYKVGEPSYDNNKARLIVHTSVLEGQVARLGLLLISSPNCLKISSRMVIFCFDNENFI